MLICQSELSDKPECWKYAKTVLLSNWEVFFPLGAKIIVPSKYNIQRLRCGDRTLHNGCSNYYNALPLIHL